MESDGTLWNVRETTCIVQAQARLTPTLTHVITYELVISGAEDDAMSGLLAALRAPLWLQGPPCGSWSALTVLMQENEPH